MSLAENPAVYTQSRTQSHIHKGWWVLVAGIAILLRVGVAFYLGDALVGPQQDRVQDQVSYNALAQSLLQGKGFSFDENWYPFTRAHEPTAHWSFLYPLFLALVYGVFGFHPTAARLIQAGISAGLSLWLLNRLGKKLFGPVAGLISAILGAVYLYFIFYDASLMTESFYILGVLAMLLVALQAAEAPAGKSAWREWGLLGGVLGITVLLRQVILLWVPFLLLWIIWARKGRNESFWVGPSISVAVLALFILPWTVRNYLVYHAFLPLNSNAGYALYASNHPHHGIHFDQDYVAPLPEDLKGQNLNEAQWSSELTRRGIAFIVDDPGRYLLLSWSRFLIFFNFWFSADSTFLSGLMRLLSFGLYLPFFITGLVLAAHQWRKISLMVLFAVVYSAIHIFTWASVRYRLPVDAALIPFAALAMEWLGVKGLAVLNLKRAKLLDVSTEKSKAF